MNTLIPLNLNKIIHKLLEILQRMNFTQNYFQILHLNFVKIPLLKLDIEGIFSNIFES